jgi:hypothetical protein
MTAALMPSFVVEGWVPQHRKVQQRERGPVCGQSLTDVTTKDPQAAFAPAGMDVPGGSSSICRRTIHSHVEKFAGLVLELERIWHM